MDLIHPHSKAETAEALRGCSASGTPVLVVGGRAHMDDRTQPSAGVELWTTQLDRVVSYEPAEMVAVVEAGMRFGALDAMLAEHEQEWPADAPTDATVGGILAAAVNSPRRLRVGALRDSLLEVEIATGDGRLVRGGGRVVKNVTGYDLPRLATGSRGTLGAIVQVALKLRPRPKARSTLVWATEHPFGLGREVLARVALPAGVLATRDRVEQRLEGWPEEVAAQEVSAIAAVGEPSARPNAYPDRTPWTARPVLTESAVPPSRLEQLAAEAGDAWGALLGVGIMWASFADHDAVATLRTRAAELGGSTRDAEPGAVASPHIHERIRAAFDPAGILIGAPR